MFLNNAKTNNKPRFIQGLESIPRNIRCHFVPFELVNHIQTRMVKGVMGDLDSYLILFGIDAMFNRVFRLSRCVSLPYKAQLKSKPGTYPVNSKRP